MESSHSSRLVLWEAMPGGGRYSWDLLPCPLPSSNPCFKYASAALLAPS